MTRMIYCLGFGLAAVALPHMVSAQSVTLDPGFYDYSHTFILGGREISSDQNEYCLREGENSRTLDELVASLSESGECSISNVSMTSSTGSADVVCTDTGLGMDISGRLEAEFGSDFYNVDTRAALGQFIPIHVKTKIRRRGACPEGSENLDDVSPN